LRIDAFDIELERGSSARAEALFVNHFVMNSLSGFCFDLRLLRWTCAQHTVRPVTDTDACLGDAKAVTA